jgi:hypothetical protein
MLQPLLAERFKLAIHRESREMNALVLTLASDRRLGSKMKKSDRECEHQGTAATAFVLTSPPADGQRPACGYISSGVGRIVGVGLDMPTIIDLIPTGPLGLPMVDQTGLKDRYDIDVTYTPTPFMAATLAQTGREPMPGVDRMARRYRACRRTTRVQAADEEDADTGGGGRSYRTTYRKLTRPIPRMTMTMNFNFYRKLIGAVLLDRRSHSGDTARPSVLQADSVASQRVGCVYSPGFCGGS